jgi:ribonuclease HI
MKTVTIVCDGSSLGNGTEAARAGAAAVLLYQDREGKHLHKVVGEYLGLATNNQAEIVAAAIALEALKEPCEVEVISDSQYVVQTMKGAFRKKKNQEFWERLDEAARRHRVTWTWTRGHSNHPLQEECDRAAREIAARGSNDPAILEDMLSRVRRTNWHPNR